MKDVRKPPAVVMAGWLTRVRAAYRSHEEDLERRLLLREGPHDVRLVPALCLVWAVSAVVATRDEALLIVLSVTGAVLLCAGALSWHLLAWRGSAPRASRRGRNAGVGLILAIAVALTGGLLGIVRMEQSGPRQLWSAVQDHRAVTVVADVAGHPEPLPQGPGRTPGSGPQEVPGGTVTSPCRLACRFTVRLQRMRWGDGWRPVDLPVEVQCQAMCAPVRYGQKVELILRAKEREGRPGSLSATAVARPRTMEPPSAFERAVSGLRQGFLLRSRAVTGEPGALLDGMVLGDRSRQTPDSAAAMTTTGLTHLTAVSGANCSVVFASVMLVLRSLRLSRPVVMLLSLLSLAAFGALVGPDSSVLRAVVMSAAAVTVMMSGHRGRGLPLLCASVAGLLLAEPWLAWDLGFALSVAATAGILIAAQGLAQWLGRWMPHAVALGLSIPLAANLTCAPLLVLVQPQLTPYSLLANALTAPLVAPVTLLGTAALALAAAPGPASGVLIEWAGVATREIWTIAQGVSGLPGALVDWPPGQLGLCTMTAFGACQVGLLWVLGHPRAVRDFYRRVHAALRDGGAGTR